MAEFSIQTLRSIYITNQPYYYPVPFFRATGTGTTNEQVGSFAPLINTGWHIIPNLLWGHICRPREWYEMLIKYEAIQVTGIKCRLFNPIPIQTATAFQGNATFPAFNNTVYALAYNDDIYETPWFNWWCKAYSSSNDKRDMFYEWNPAYKEGAIPAQLTTSFATIPEGQCAQQRQKYNETAGVMSYPKEFTTRTHQSDENSFMEKIKLRRQFLPIYWYSFPFKQYINNSNVGASWHDLSSDFEYAYNDCSGIFWDPLNRPDELMELRPGKNMIEFGWNIHEADSHIWFNLDRIASLTPYGRPRALHVDPGCWNMPFTPRMIDPRGPGNSVNRYDYLKYTGLMKQGETITVQREQMAPESGMSIPDWRRWPVVPSRWFYEELREQNPWVYQNMRTRLYDTQVTGCPDMSTTQTKAGDVQITGPYQDIKFAGTEYEQHKYPPTQWFIKAVPLFDAGENRINVEMQMFMQITLTLKGKTRKSALYAPSWGPIENMNLYSVNMDTPFNESYMRVRSGGARRTYYDVQDGPPEMKQNPDKPLGQLYPRDSSAVSEEVVPYDINQTCIVHTSATQPPELPMSHVYSNQGKPSLLVTIDDDGRNVEMQDDDFEIIK